MFLLYLAAIVLWFLLVFFTKKRNFWREKGVVFETSCHSFRGLPFQKPLVEVLSDIYHKHPNLRYVGYVDFIRPVLVVRDPNLINELLVANYSHFQTPVWAKIPKTGVFARGLPNLTETDWQRMKSTLHPIFTKTNKFPELALDHFGSFLAAFRTKEPIQIDVAKIFSQCTSDFIARIGFGKRVQSLESPKNEFLRAAKDYGRNVEFFRGLIREDSPIDANLCQRLLDVKKGADSEDVFAQILLLLVGLETTSTEMSFMAYELAINPEIQRKLQSEVDCGAKAALVRDFGYLDQVIYETLRKWPPSPYLERLCTEDYVISPEQNEKLLKIQRGQSVLVPVMALHNDPKHYPNPEVFNPDRFKTGPEASPGVFYPFGVGPRSCLGSNIALLAIKSLFVELLIKFDILPGESTEIPVELKCQKQDLVAKNGFRLVLRPRKKPIKV